MSRVPGACPVWTGAHHHPERLAVVTPSVETTYRQLEIEITARMRSLQSLNVSRGVRVGLIMTENQPRWVTTIWALFRLGAVAVLPNTRQPAASQEEALRSSGTRIVVDADRLADLEKDEYASTASEGADGYLHPHLPATILFTSGTTGPNQGMIHSLANHWFSADGSRKNLPVGPESRWLIVLPLYHAGGLSILFRCFLSGATVVLPDAMHWREAPGRLRFTHVSVVPTQLGTWIEEAPAEELQKVTSFLVGGAVTPASLVESARTAGLSIHRTYGLTEMASQVCTTPPGASADDLETSGRVLPYRRIRIADGGEIQVRGATRFMATLDPSLQAARLTPDGWLKTGDRGEIDDMARLRVLGRLDNMFVSGGENIYPEEIEKLLTDKPCGLAYAVVVSTRHESFGSVPVAFVPPDTDRRRLRQMLRAYLPGYKIPDLFLDLPEEISADKPPRARLSRYAEQVLDQKRREESGNP